MSSRIELPARLHIRRANARDVPKLTALYRDSVEALGPESYSLQQVETWAAFAEADTFPLFISTAATFVAEDETGILGFSGVEGNGHVASIYVRPDSFRRGIGSRLLTTILNYTTDLEIPTLFAEASHFSRPLFRKHGFVDTGTEIVARNGINFERFLMRWTQNGD